MAEKCKLLKSKNTSLNVLIYYYKQNTSDPLNDVYNNI